MNQNKKCGNFTICELFEQKLKIPSYQRPYSWEKEQVIDLIEDLIESSNKNDNTYLIGNMIFHKEIENDDLNIVDGQQRTITLALILFALKDNNEKEEKCECFLDQKVSDLSSKKIYNNYQIIQNKLKNVNGDTISKLKKHINENVIITYLKTESQDEAFILFDSQNTRGKALQKKDLLKVHHLRHTENIKNVELLQEKYIYHWEEIEEPKIQNNEIKVNLQYILEFFIAFPRLAIRGELKPNNINYIDVFKEFKSNSNVTRLNNYNQPSIFYNYSYDFEKKEAKYFFKEGKDILFGNALIVRNDLVSLPFEINQSIVGGERFFWFVFKYVELAKVLEEKKDFKIFDRLFGTGNIYLRKIYKSILFFYYDKFSEWEFDNFIEKILKLTVLIRIKKDSIRADGVIKFEWNEKSSLNIFSIINNHSSPYEILKDINRYFEYEVDNDFYTNYIKLDTKNKSSQKDVLINSIDKERIEKLFGVNNGK